MSTDEDLALALQLEEEINGSTNGVTVLNEIQSNKKLSENENVQKKQLMKGSSLVDPSWEYIDPTPDVHALFIQFDNRFFWGKLKNVEVRWSPRMTSCAGVCCYEGHGGLCSVRLSVPLLKLRPRKDLVETLLHEMIHAFLFVTHNNRDRDGHGPEFYKHMYRINKEAGTNISVYHSFHGEVRLYQQHWWRCDGPCQKRPPYYGMVKRSMNRAPGPYDFWWKEHEASCGGQYKKIKEPPGFSQKGGKQGQKKSIEDSGPKKGDIRNFFPNQGTSSKSGKNIFGFNDLTSGSSDNKIKLTSDSNIYGFNNLSGSGDTNPPTSTSHSNNKTNYTPNMNKNVVGFKDLTGNNINNGSKINPKTSQKKPTGNNTNVGKVGGDTFKAPAQNGGGRARGMLANKGGGTSVITVKGKLKDKEDSTNSNKVNSNNITPFTGKGHVLGSSGTANNSGTSRLLSLQSSVSSKTAKSLKRPPSIISDNDSFKKSKNGSIVDLTTVLESECSGEDEKLVKCPVCDLKVNEQDINTHLDSCLNSSVSHVDSETNTSNKIECDSNLVQFDKEYELENHSGKCSDESEIEDNSVKCAVCNKRVLKCEMETHLEDCLGTIFEKSETIDDTLSDKSSESGISANQYPCPCCALLLEHSKMNSHLDRCLAGVWDDFNSTL